MSTTPAACPVCLATIETRGGDPLYCPGCCGKWFHQKCVDELIANGQTECPHCRKKLPVSTTATTLPRTQHRPVQRHVRPPRATNIFSSIFSFGNSNTGNSNIQPQSIQQQQQSFAPSIGNQVNSMLMREEPVEPITTSNTDNSSEVSNLPEVSVTAIPEFTEASIAEQPSFYAQVTLRYEETMAAMEERSKTAMDLICILDNSGSMSGRKIESLKSAVEFIIDRLGSNDRLSIVHFNSRPGGLHGLLRMNSENKETSKQILRELRATGGTDIYAGMKYGWDIMQRRTTRNPTTCVFLLTDGQDRSNINEKLHLAREIKNSGSSLFVFGFGSDHDSEHMSAIADAGESAFTYIESDDMVVDAFGGTIGTQQMQALSNINLTIEACEHDVRILATQAGRYTTTVASDGRRSTVQFRNMYMGETREILLKLSVPAVASAMEDYALIMPSVTYQAQEDGATLSRSGAACIIQRLSQEQLTSAATSRNIQIDLSLNRILCTESVASAVRDADSGNFGAAKMTIATAKAKLQSSISYQQLVVAAGNNTTALGAGSALLALMQELDDALLRVNSRDDYHRGGKAMMMETVSANSYQRSTYTKCGRAKKYQSSMSSNVQETAMNSKGKKS